MVSSNAHLAIEQEKIAFTNTAPKEADFEVGCKSVILKTTASVYIAFDRPANSDDFLYESTDGVIEIHEPMQFTKVSALGSSGSGTLYIIARR